MKTGFALTIIVLAVIILFPATAVQAQELYDESVISVDGAVDEAPAPAPAGTQNANAPGGRDLVKFRQRHDGLNFQSPPPDGKASFQLKVEARSYCMGGFTSRGAPTRVGVVAVDPAVIPFGSKIYVPGYGWGTALDTGGAIRGNSIDIWMPTYSQCMQWGVRSITVKVVKP